MKNCMRKFFAALAVLLIFSLTFIPRVYANEMSSIAYDVELQADGSGIITETRKMYLTEDTEIYITFDRLSGSEVTDFHVSDFGEPLEEESDWDVSASREEKAGKYGIVETSDGVELCWGIGDYGEHEYTVTYTMTNMVRQLEDGQGMNWQFFNGKGNIPPEEVTIRIAGPQSFDQDNTLIWGFGFDGEVYLEDGELTGWSNTALSDSNYITILMQFPDQPFKPSLSLDQTLSEQEEKAKEGSSYNDKSSDDELTSFLGIIALFIFASIFTTIFTMMRARAIKREHPLVTGKQREKINEDQYYRDIPYQEGPITDVAYFLQEVGSGNIEDYFNAFMLKWLKEGRISVTTEIRGRLIKKETTLIKLEKSKPKSFDTDVETRIWDVITSAADNEGVLDEDQLKKHAKTNYDDIQNIEEDLPVHSKKLLLKEGYLEEGEARFLFTFTAKVIKGTDRGEALFNQIVQFRNYLTDFSLLDEREIKEVALWDDLFVWASLYGIAEKVAKQLEKIYPNYFEEAGISYSDIYLMHIYSKNMSSGYKSGSSASSGAGGSTSIGGGGGSFGGGGGGSR